MLLAVDLTIVQADITQLHLPHFKPGEGNILQLTVDEFASLYLHIVKHDLSHSTSASFKSDVVERGSGNTEPSQVRQFHPQIADRRCDDRRIPE